MRFAGLNISKRTVRRQCSTATKRGHLLAAIDTSSITGLRDRALIGTMIYTFARVGAVLQMNVADYFTQGRRGRVTLQAKINVALDPRLHGARIYEVLLQRSILGLTHIGNDKR